MIIYIYVIIQYLFYFLSKKIKCLSIKNKKILNLFIYTVDELKSDKHR